MRTHSAIIRPLIASSVDAHDMKETGIRFEWQCLDNRQRPIGQINKGSPEQLARQLNGGAATLLLKASEVVDSRIQVPLKQQKQLSQLLAFEIEPQLASDISQLQIAGKVVAGEDVAVAHVDRSLISSYINELERAGVAVAHCYSEGHLYRATPSHWLLIADESTGSVTCCWGGSRYCTVKLGQLGMLVKALLQAHSAPAKVTILARMKEDADVIAEAIQERLESRLSTETGEHVAWSMLDTDATATRVELRQGDFQAPLRWRRNVGWLRLPAMAAGLALVTYIAATALSTYQANRQFEALQVAIEDSYRQAMPQGVLVDAAQQLRSQLSQITGGQSGPGLLSVLDQVAPALQRVSGIQIQRLNYSAGRQELNLSVTALSNDDILSLNDALAEAGLNARAQNIRRQGDSHQAQFVIFAPGVTS